MWFCLSAPQDQKVKDGCHYDITHISPISIPYGDLICRARSTSRLSCLWSHLLITLGKKVNIEQQIEDGMSSRKVLAVFQCFSLGPLSFWQAFSNFLAIYRISGCMGITRGKTNIHRKHLLPKILHIPHTPLSSPLCFSFLKSEGLRRLKRLNIQARGGRGHQHYESPGTSH